MVGFPPNHPILIGFSIINHPFWGKIPLFLVQHPNIPCQTKWPSSTPSSPTARPWRAVPQPGGVGTPKKVRKGKSPKNLREIYLDVPGRKLGSLVSKWVISYNLLINGVYGGYNPLTNDLLSSLRIMASQNWWFGDPRPLRKTHPNPSIAGSSDSQGWWNIVLSSSSFEISECSHHLYINSWRRCTKGWRHFESFLPTCRQQSRPCRHC